MIVTAKIKSMRQGKIRPDPDLPLMEANDKTLYTIGYGNRTPNVLVQMLKDAGIRTIRDVRGYNSGASIGTYSTRAGGNGIPINNFFTRIGVDYRHIYLLGNPGKSIHGYEELLAHNGLAQHQLDVLASNLKAEYYNLNFCLLCAEIDPAKCHRSILAEDLVKRLGNDWEVKHL